MGYFNQLITAGPHCKPICLTIWLHFVVVFLIRIFTPHTATTAHIQSSSLLPKSSRPAVCWAFPPNILNGFQVPGAGVDIKHWSVCKYSYNKLLFIEVFLIKIYIYIYINVYIYTYIYIHNLYRLAWGLPGTVFKAPEPDRKRSLPRFLAETSKCHAFLWVLISLNSLKGKS